MDYEYLAFLAVVVIFCVAGVVLLLLRNRKGTSRRDDRLRREELDAYDQARRTREWEERGATGVNAIVLVNSADPYAVQPSYVDLSVAARRSAAAAPTSVLGEETHTPYGGGAYSGGVAGTDDAAHADAAVLGLPTYPAAASTRLSRTAQVDYGNATYLSRSSTTTQPSQGATKPAQSQKSTALNTCSDVLAEASVFFSDTEAEAAVAKSKADPARQPQ